ncbi:Carboxypeptidase regulatory-like domain-containing protein [Arenibacter nanhaiticus]|uniref:Carboxypeptidase regulatory-like domain-containing protein n=1 Tax=Arenibacter nanhaiticus TaxID=558155 RepID=A0A1M6M6A2_9FLAO|nr:OmpA family protein [Arenibacter nanhaiticus]SHJ78967.1 Carboxypeptidase regulatory-like domain-containing protein [Arenibacter nanhaiticus]
MRIQYIALIFTMLTSIAFSQVKQSKGDVLFFEYSYNEAIKEYQKELREGALSNKQYLNLADAYFKTSDYKKSAEIYVNMFQKDTSMSKYHFNRMLQSLSYTSDLEGVKKYFEAKKPALSGELLENTGFNESLITSDTKDVSDYKIFNVSSNSAQADFSPTFYKDKILFSSDRPQKGKNIYEPSGEAYLDIYEAALNSQGDIVTPEAFKGIAESKFHQATPYYSKELDYIFYILSNSEDDYLQFSEKGKNALSIGMGNGRGSFKYVLRDLNTSFYYPFFEAKTGRLFFAANFEDSLGGTDIYYVYTNDGLIMSGPINLGPRINTPGNEIAPYIFENTLYFSSDIFYGLGGMDIYKSNLQEDNSFSLPINLGEGINSPKDDFGFIIKRSDNNGLIGYFSSNREGGKGNDDIYGFKVQENLGLKTLALKGMVVNLASNRGIANAQLRLLNKQGNVIKELTTDSEGRYRVEVPFEDTVTIEATKDRHSIFSVTYEAPELEEIQKRSLNMGIKFLDDLVEQKEGQPVIKLNKFYFTKGDSYITPEIAQELDKVVDVISRFPHLRLRIESHTDSRGGDSANLTLSQKRSNAINKYLIQNGVSQTNIIEVVGYGEERLTNNCKNGVFCLDILHNKNERSLIVVLNYQD